MKVHPPCQVCGVAMVTQRSVIPPGMKRIGGRGLCTTCYQADRRGDVEPIILFSLRPWLDDALCAQADPEVWFPEIGDNAGKAKAVCGRCPVSAECLADALATGDHHGIRGGLGPRARRKLATGAA